VTSNLLPLRHLDDGMLDVMVRGSGDAGRRTPFPLGSGLGRGLPGARRPAARQTLAWGSLLHSGTANLLAT
jgi:hypothetical protein